MMNETVAANDQLLEMAGRLALSIGRINRRIRPTGGGLSNGLLSALASVVRCGPVRPGDLAQLEVVSAPTLTRVIAELESRGLIEREVDLADRRSFFLKATPAGAELFLDARSERAALMAALLSELSGSQVAAIHDALDALEMVTGTSAPREVTPSIGETAAE